MNTRRDEDLITREILEAIGERSDVTQRHLAQRLGVALGLANSYLRRCVRKGLVKLTQAPANRYLYYLTPQGFAEKSRLTGEYLSVSLRFYRHASDACVAVLDEAQARGMVELGLYGRSELAEIAALRALERGRRIACLCDPRGGRQAFFERPVVRTTGEADGVDGWVLTELQDPARALERLLTAVGAERVLVPGLLGLAPPWPAATDAGAVAAGLTPVGDPAGQARPASADGDPAG